MAFLASLGPSPNAAERIRVGPSALVGPAMRLVMLTAVREPLTAAVEEFERQRPRLMGLAYRMLGSAQEAEDVVQDAYLRWRNADHVEVPAAWLAKVVTNLCLNHLASARARRESYVGPWLPEPVPTGSPEHGLGPLETVEQRDTISMALLTLMERLTPSERAVFVLREAFSYSHREIGDVLDIEETSSRQLYRRARQRLGEPSRRFEPNPEEWHRLVERFLNAAVNGDLAALESMLTEDVTAWADGGGKVTAARRPIVGRERVIRYMLGMAEQAMAYAEPLSMAIEEFNGAPALTVWVSGELFTIVTFSVENGRIAAFRTVVNPDKLAYAARHLS